MTLRQRSCARLCRFLPRVLFSKLPFLTPLLFHHGALVFGGPTGRCPGESLVRCQPQDAEPVAQEKSKSGPCALSCPCVRKRGKLALRGSPASNSARAPPPRPQRTSVWKSPYQRGIACLTTGLEPIAMHLHENSSKLVSERLAMDKLVAALPPGCSNQRLPFATR